MSKKHKKRWDGEDKKEDKPLVTKVYDGKTEKKWGEDQKKEDSVTCSLVREPVVFIALRAKYKIKMLMMEYTTKEWIGYLQGDEYEDGDVLVNDLIIPPHEESSYAEAVAEPFNKPDECVGVIHSHHGMRAFHSGTDQSHVDRNFPISITVARETGTTASEGKLEFDAVSNKTTPCGKFLMVKATVRYLNPEPDFDEKAWLEEAKANVAKGNKVYGCAYQGGANPAYPHGCQGYQSGFDRQGIAKKEAEADKKDGWGDKDKVPILITKKMCDALSQRIFDQCNGLILSRVQLAKILEEHPTAHIDGDFDSDNIWTTKWSP